VNQDKSSYQQIFKATSLFGGVQVFNIIVAIIRSKFIAVLLGPMGMGIAGLLNSTTTLISALTNFGLGTSAVKDIAAANATNNQDRIARVVTVFRRLVWITGILGAVIVLVFSHLLSRITFGNGNYTIAFIWLSMTLLFSQLSTGQGVLLQGMRKLQHLAKANLVGAIAGLTISIPIYYYWHIDGIVPAIILTSIASLSISWFFARKIPVKKTEVNFREVITEGKSMLRMGFMISLSGLITLGASYVVRIYISRQGGISDVGLYNAGFAIISTYVGLVFTAMGTDYYPRLSSVADDNKQAAKLINQQAEVAILILGPILSFFLIFIHWIVIILYSTKFVAVNGMIHYAALGIYFKAASWAMGFIFLAKGASKVFFWNELFANAYMLSFNLLGYYFFGLDGLGISFLISYLLYLLQVYIIVRRKYSFSFSYEFYKAFILQLTIGILCFFCVKFLQKPWAYGIGINLLVLSVWYSFNELNKRIGLLSVFRNFKEHFRRK
jgi:O-antigen/teichoic acid export membrane protein